MTPEQIKKKLELLRFLYKQETDPKKRMEIVKEASNYQCTHEEEKNGQKMRCRNPRRNDHSFICEDHIWRHEEGKSGSRLTVKEMQSRLHKMAENVRKNGKLWYT